MLGYPATSNRVTQITRGAQTVKSFTYDNAGNLLTDSAGTAYAYNNRNRLSTATIGAIVWNYSYNALEQLSIRSRVSPAATTHFIHDLWGNVIAETAGGGATGATGTTREYIWMPETEIAPADGARSQVDRPLAVVNAVNTTPVTWSVSVDHLNRPIQMTDAAKASVWAATWLPWGGVHAITGTATLDARFPGQWFQAETGLHYNWHRHYDPTIGRYTHANLYDLGSAVRQMSPLPLTTHAKLDTSNDESREIDSDLVALMVAGFSDNHCQSLKTIDESTAHRAEEPLPNADSRNPHQTKVFEDDCGCLIAFDQAEREGFEPSVPLRARRFSRPVHSTALPSLRAGGSLGVAHGSNKEIARVRKTS